MALETVVFEQDPFSCSRKDLQYALGGGGTVLPWSYEHDYGEDDVKNHNKILVHNINTCVGQGSNVMNAKYLDYCTSSSSMVQSVNNNINNGDIRDAKISPAGTSTAAAATVGRRKQRRTRSVKNKEEVENQRMTHITVERNRRKQMNDYFAVLRSMMPSSYVQRGDQASIVGGAINFVKELEQLLQSLEAHKRINQHELDHSTVPSLFSDFFIFPQYLTFSVNNKSVTEPKSTAEKRCAIADVEVTMVESHANIKVLLKRHQKQLVKMVVGLQFLRLVVLHLNVTTVDSMVLYSFSVKVEDDSELTSVNEIAASVYEMVGRIQEEADLIS
ncbi:hypothetical protein L484_019813 [Morus notabilis]|uniref:BHLH domain-containing protein n=1 Tax=Morus notabilis TaxID=981085 RepID=W9S1T4_9ROSA|nr:transcription factor bHLH96 [Morus notabilis]EXC09716.1 hypothetical protein L484_019813 [Morus notabilis]